MTPFMTLVVVSALLAVISALIYYRHGVEFRPPRRDFDGTMTEMSVLVPARNEEASIGRALEAILASRDVTIEVVVLDDHSEDRTAEIVRSFVERDPRVRLLSAPELPPGWCGKQFACATLAGNAKYQVLTFLDADVRLDPVALRQLAQFQRDTGAALVSGFPRQETVTLLEQLVLPLINWLIVCFLPIRMMRASTSPAFGAGCGQWFLTTRDAYIQAGGHGAIRDSLHDGVKLPRAYRAAGLATDICDATSLATCRMYTTARGVWNGLAKNAHEGLGGFPAILVWTAVLFGGQVLPFGLALVWVGTVWVEPVEKWLTLGGVVVAVVSAWGPRLLMAERFRQSLLGAIAHPLGVTLLLLIQWYAATRRLVGRPVGWKGRPRPALS